MSFGYSVGDFFTVVHFAWDTFEKCRASTSAFRDLGRDVGNAHIVLRSIYRFWKSEEERNQNLLVPQQDELKQLAENCHAALKEVENIRQKHGDLDRSGSVRARVTWVIQDIIHDFAAIRGRLQQYTGNLALFHTMLTTEALHEASGDQIELLESLKQQSDIIKIFVTSYQQYQESKREEPAYSQVAKTAVPEQQQQHTFDAAEEELRAEGIDKAVILKHRELISEWLETVILAPTNDREEDEGRTALESSTAVEEEHSAPLKRSGSVDTHRSQSSAWGSPDADEVKDYGAKMIAKVLRSKYPCQSWDESFQLPIKRAFHHLDWTNRGWLPHVEVVQQCHAAALKLRWELDLSAIARLVKMEDSKESNPDHRIVLTEFTNIILAVRQDIFVRIMSQSLSNGLPVAAKALKDWITSNSGYTKLSRHWSRQERARMIADIRYAYLSSTPEYTLFTTYSQDFAGDIAEGTAPLSRNFTNAIYLATTFCMSLINSALSRWRAIKNWPAIEQDEVLGPLNRAVDAAASFHMLETDQDLGIFHSLDRLIEDASLTPLSHFQDMQDSPSKTLEHIRGTCWALLDQIVGFVSELDDGAEKMSNPTGLPDIKIWRELRMLDRAQNLSSQGSIFNDIAPEIERARKWRDQHESLTTHCETCVKNTKLLKGEQESAIVIARTSKIIISNVGISKVPHAPFRRPKSLFKGSESAVTIYVDGERQITSTAVRSETPVWSFYGNHLSVNRSSRVKFFFFTVRTNDHKSAGPFGFSEFIVKDTVDFERKAQVNLKCYLEGCTSKIELTFSVSPVVGEQHPLGFVPRSETQKEEAERKRSELPLAAYIISHPIPEDWQIRRSAHDGVYFFNAKTSEPTAVLWTDPLYTTSTESPLEPLPPGWKRVAREGQIWYSPIPPNLGEDTKSLPTSDDPVTFEHVLKPKRYHFPEAFHVA